MSSYINAPPARAVWLAALSRLAGVRNGDYLTQAQLQRALDGAVGQQLRDLLAAGEREGFLLIDRGARPTSYRATFALERAIMLHA